MNEEQIDILRSAIAAEADPEFVGYREKGQTPLVTKWFEAPTDTTVWRTRVSHAEVTQHPQFPFAEMASLTAGQVLVWETLWRDGHINPSRENVRAALAVVFPADAKGSVLDAVLAACKRPATRYERLYAVGVGDDLSPATLVIEGSPSDQIVTAAREAKMEGVTRA